MPIGPQLPCVIANAFWRSKCSSQLALVQQLREQNWRTKMLGSAEDDVAPPTRNLNQPWARDSHQCRLSGQPVGTGACGQEIKQRLQVPELRRRRCKIVDCTGRMRHSTHEHGASEGYRTPAVHSRSVRDVVSFRRLDHVSKQR